MTHLTFKTLKQSLIASGAVLLLGAGTAMGADTSYDGQRAAQALLSPTISAPAVAHSSSAGHAIDRTEDAQAQARRLLAGERITAATTQRVAAASSSHARLGDDGGVLARRMILGGGA
jgi:hypothetical protein